MAPQITRVLILFGGLVLLFLAVRSQVMPEGFATDGFHRVEAPEILAAQKIVHAGREACATCHSKIAEVSPHVLVGVGCESCHGPGKAHVDDWETVKPHVPATRADCARCHNRIVGRPDWFPQQSLSEHNPGVPCMTCHNIHPVGDDKTDYTNVPEEPDE